MENTWKTCRYIYPNGTVIDFNGLYEVNEEGLVKHLPHIRIKNGVEQLYKEKISNYSKQKGRYCDTYFIKEGVSYKIQIHRLVLSTFKPESDTYECVNHKDRNTHNNNLENLEWCTSKYNNNYKDRNKRLSNSLIGLYNKTGGCKITLQYSLTGILIKEWPSASEASRFYNISKASINRCCRGITKSCLGYIWKYK